MEAHRSFDQAAERRCRKARSGSRDSGDVITRYKLEHLTESQLAQAVFAVCISRP